MGRLRSKIQELGWFLRTFCYGHQDSWNQFLGWAKYAQNSLHQSITGLTPLQCVLGYQPPLFPWSGEPSEVPAVVYWFREREGLGCSSPSAATSLSQTQDDGLPETIHCPSLSTWSEGLAVDQGHQNAPTLQEAKSQIHWSLHHHQANQPEPGVTAEPPLPLILEDGVVYPVNEILDSQHCGGLPEYLVDWEDYGPEERSWVDTTSLNPLCSTPFTPLIRIDLLPVEEEDHQGVGVLDPRELAVGRGVLSQTRQAPPVTAHSHTRVLITHTWSLSHTCSPSAPYH
ncbi:uncharacterized protein LOC122882712 [Siniperca chuatsi]|uniref:uncharacterized protein LOC122882712 n=1 Tax=Siniperca chuatsi TaxID=119488 RepID=UPI001CE113F1|nr:uncharacterized protein LOC122882712 [Siniperca chuatsi]